MGSQMIQVKVEWAHVPDGEQRLRRVYDLLLREQGNRSHAEPTIQELLLRGLNMQREYVPQRTLAHGQGGTDDRPIWLSEPR